MEIVRESIQFAMEHWVISTLVVIVTYAYWHYQVTFLKIRKLGLKGPTPLPLIGNSWNFLRGGQLHDIMTKNVKKYGKVYGSYFISYPVVVVADPDILKAMLVKDFGKFHDRPTIGLEFSEPLDSMLSIVPGQRWKNIRSVISPTFTSGKLKQMMFIMNEASDTLLSKLENVANTNTAVDIHEWQQGVTMEVILSSAFGMKTESQTNPNDKLTKLAQAAMEQKPWPQIALLIPFVGKFLSKMLMSSERFGFGWGGLIKIARGIVKSRKEASDGGERRKDMLNLMLDSQNPDNKGYNLTDNEILAEMIVFILAGYDTSSNILGLTCYNLALHPEIQDKVFDEISQVCSSNDSVAYDEIQKLPYLEACISETLRLYPPGFILSRLVTESCSINGVPFEKGMSILVPVYTLHHDEQYWPEPETFRPERFLPENKDSIHPFTYLPFGDGPRNCIGMRLAWMEMKSVLVRMLQKYRLVRGPETKVPIKVKPRAVLAPAEPILVRIEKRVDK
eukprot:gene606-1268_t